jgi:glucosyl-dolichyl phosphate glucuronosyltransferase
VASDRAPGVSVVIPSWRRPEGLRRLLAALAHEGLDDCDWDVVVVASASDTSVHQTVANHGVGLTDAAPARFMGLKVVDEPRPGASNARNRGLRESRRTVAFIDDDCCPERGWLAAVTAPVREGIHAGAGGPVVLDRAARKPRWLGESLLAYLAAYDRGPTATVLDPEDYVLTANAAFDADALARSGGFDPRLGPNAGRPFVDDDIDVCRKVVGAGGTIAYTPDAVVVHHLPPARLRPSYLLERMYAQGRSDWLLDRARLRAQRLGGLGEEAGRAWTEQRRILRQGPWRPSVAFHAVGAAASSAGYARQALVSRKTQGP